MVTASGQTEESIPVGNYYNKYQSSNFIVRRIMKRFFEAFNDLVTQSGASEAYEVGCGEGFLARELAAQGLKVRASDFSEEVVNEARELSRGPQWEAIQYEVRDIYQLQEVAPAPLIVCCEVMEHLTEPEQALRSIQNIATSHVLLSVPCEPLWRILNVSRGRYLTDLGNTPGHLQHWSRRGFANLVKQHFEIEVVRPVLPWTFVLARVRY